MLSTNNATNQGLNISEFKTAMLLSGIYASRMLGLFLIFPTFSLLAEGLDNTTPLKIGLALGGYSLAQALLQIPAGILSDIFGRKKILYLGLTLFLLGSLLAANTNDIDVLIWARILQGTGAVSSVSLAYVADNIRDSQQPKVMAIIGISIASSFIISFIIGSIVSDYYGLRGLFITISILAAGSILFAFLLPQPKQHISNFKISSFVEALKNKRLIDINFQILLLHATLSASFFLLPMLVTKSFGDDISYVALYLPSILIAFVLILPLMKKREKAKKIMVIKWGILSFALLLFAVNITYETQFMFTAVMTIFFFSFTYIEAMLPTRLFAVAPDTSRGATTGIYSVYQYMGNFLGGILGAKLYSFFVLDGTIHYSFFVLAIVTFIVFIASFVLKDRG